MIFVITMYSYMNEITKLYLITDLYNMKLCQKKNQSLQEYRHHKLRDEMS